MRITLKLIGSAGPLANAKASCEDKHRTIHDLHVHLHADNMTNYSMCTEISTQCITTMLTDLASVVHVL